MIYRTFLASFSLSLVASLRFCSIGKYDIVMTAFTHNPTLKPIGNIQENPPIRFILLANVTTLRPTYCLLKLPVRLEAMVVSFSL